jgi:hypothetical protein
MPNNPSAGPHHRQIGKPSIPVKPINHDAEFMHHIPALINTLADGNPETANEWKTIVRLRRLNGESWESVHQLLSQAAFPSI